MSIFNSTSGTASVNVVGVSNPQIDSISLLLANTEYPVVLPAATRRFRFKSRNKGTLLLRYASGGNYETIPYGTFCEEIEIDTATLTIYLESSTASQIVELTTWT